MNNIIFYNAGISQANLYAVSLLQDMGYQFCREREISAATHLLLDTPCKHQVLPENISNEITIIGGNLQFPHPCIDLLKEPQYLAENAMITAHGAIRVALRETQYILPDRRILIIGWGRIGKCLSKLLSNMGCCVTVAARKETDRAILSALGYTSCSVVEMNTQGYDIIFNTAPALLIDGYNAPATVIDLASQQGIRGKNVITARGLPGKEFPASSGKLIAESINRLLNRKEYI